MDTSNKDDGGEYKRAVKMVIAKQLKELLQQLENSGQEVSMMTVDLEDGVCSHFGTTYGELFIGEKPDMMSTFLDFCKSKSNLDTEMTDAAGDNNCSTQNEDPINEAKETIKKPVDRKKVRKTVKSATASSEVVSDVLQLEIPKKCTTALTGNEVAGLVGRLVASQLVTTKQKGDAAGSTLKFKMLLEAANRALKKDKRTNETETSPVKAPSTPGSTRSGRKVSSKFLESLNSLKKQSKVKEEVLDNDYMEDESISEERDFLQEISIIDSSILKRVHIKSEDGKLVDATLAKLTSSPELETLAIQLINELDLLTKKHPIFSHKFIKVMINTEADTDAIRAQLVKCDWTVSIKKERGKYPDSQEINTEDKSDEVDLVEMDETEASELREDLGEFIKEMDTVSDPDFNVKVTKTGGRKAAVKIGKAASSSPTPAGLIRKPKVRHYTETMPIDCQHCGITMTGRSNLKSHIKRVHMNIRNHSCSICRKGFWSSNALESHMLSVHTRQCEACQEYVVESVPWSQELTMKTRRDVICTCGAIVSIFSTFGRKRMYLRDDEPDDEGNVYIKRQKNNPGTKYACGTCGKLFMKKSNCERHSRRHTDVKNCVCDICGQAYMYESSLKKHMATEHGIMNHVCELCGGNYATATALKVHIVRAHRHVTVGEDVTLVLKEKADLKIEEEEEYEDEEEEEEIEELHAMDAGDDQPEIIVNGTSGEIIVQHKGQSQEVVNTIQTTRTCPTEKHSTIVVSRPTGMEEQSTEQIVLTQAEGMSVGEEHMVIDQGNNIVITTDGTDQTAQLVQQVIDGQVVSQDGEMSIIIKQIPIENEIY